MRVRKFFAELKMEGNPFVSSVPTDMKLLLIEQSPNLLRLRKVNQPNSVPYCDCFFAEEEIIVAMPDGCSSSSVFRSSCRLVFVKSTMMRGIICSTEAKVSAASWKKIAAWMRSNGHGFKEKVVAKKIVK